MPHVEKYMAEAIHKTGGITVAGGPRATRYKDRKKKRVIPPALGRKFFTGYDEMLRYCRRYMERERDNHMAAYARLEEALKKSDLGLEIIPHGSWIDQNRAGGNTPKEGSQSDAGSSAQTEVHPAVPG